MKTRIGFVSNSSSTSFTLAGICIDEARTKELFKVEDMRELYDLDDISVFMDPNTEYFAFVGLILSGESEHCELKSEMRDDETKIEFLARASKVLSEKTGQPIEATFVSSSWYNG
jgi:hypothetical protein